MVKPVPQSGLGGNFTVLLEAVPNANFSGSPHEDGRHRAEVRIPAQSVPVSSLGAHGRSCKHSSTTTAWAVATLPRLRARVLDGKPFAYARSMDGSGR